MIRAIVAVALMLVGCDHDNRARVAPPPLPPPAAPDAGSAAPADPPTGPGTDPGAAAALAPDAACARFDALASAGCSWTQRFPPEFRDAHACTGSLTSWFAPDNASHDTLARTVACWALDCDAAAACMVQVQAAAAPPPPRECGDPGTAPIVVDAAQWAARRGAAARRFADVHTSEAEPIEVCGIDGEVEWMTRMTCGDGSHPYASTTAANDARDAWVARGGRCNSVLDRYSVRCPDATYQVHVDRYVCPG